MGELLRKIGTLDMKDFQLDVELNNPSANGLERSVHLQNQKFRLEMSESEFYQVAGAILESYRQFEWIKGESLQKQASMMEDNP